MNLKLRASYLFIFLFRLPRFIFQLLNTFPDNRFPAFFSSILLFMAVNPGNVAPSSNLFPSGCYTNAIQEQIAASHEFDGVRKEKERLTAASLKTCQKEYNFWFSGSF